MTDEEAFALAERIRSACVQAAEEAYQQAAISGLCGSGAWEVAIGAVKTLDITTHVTRFLEET